MAAPPITPTRAARHQQQGKPQGRERKQAPPGRSRLRRILRWALWLAVPAIAIAAGTVVGLIYAFARVPLPAEVPTAQTIVFLDDTGRHEIGTLSAQENRRVVKLEKIPEHTRQAVLAAEDRDFHEHGAISWRGLARATAANLLRRRISEGGSTITQQYVKNAFPGVGRDRTLFRKLKEAVLAVKLERKFSKDQILEFYMNTVYFGRGAYGIDAAARAYFSVPARNGRPARKENAETLSPAQSATLAGVIRSPEFYGRREHQASAKARRNYILQAMVDRGWLTAKDGRAAIASRLGISWAATRQGIANSSAPYFLEKVRQYLIARYGSEAVNMGGLRVRTTLNLRMQRQAEAAVQGLLDQPATDPRAALVAIDPRNGAVRALYGGRNFQKRQFNYATDSIRQAGSTMKPFVLAQALNDGYSVNSVYPGPAELIVDGEDFKNYGDTNYGQMTLRDATRLSVNTIYVQLMQQVQPKRVASFAKAHGLAAELGGAGGADKDPQPLEKLPVLKPVLALSLGSGDVTTLQLASAFGTWANRGIHQAPRLVEKVVDSNGRVLEDNRRPQGAQVIAPVHADTMNMVLRGAVENGTGNGARLFGREVAGKTGTTSDYTDARFVGYTTDLVASVWLGFDDPDKKLVNVRGLAGVSGGSLPATIWRNFMDQATRDRPSAPFVVPAELGGQVLNPTTTAPPATVPSTTQPATPGPPQPQPGPPQPGPTLPPTPTSLAGAGPAPDPTTRA
ncbi:MAG TPA: transglycosylase domain-containing protein [Actinomycetota bacterium]|nr:transglycosylase domain-containing protein [Actinomycetota bacterium]